jgi:hypothetical protein
MSLATAMWMRMGTVWRIKRPIATEGDEGDESDGQEEGGNESDAEEDVEEDMEEDE